ncbi:MAG: glycosyltransferase family 39 protein, partial [Bryobacteraceae bacterium]
MTTEGKAARYAAISALGFLFLVNVYRAATQSMTHDEAYTYQLYIAAPVSRIFEYFNPNNHFFAVILMKISTVVLGVSEFTMRLPSVVSGGFYFYFVYRLCLLAFGQGYLFLISVLLLSTNPFLLDFHVAARGYGIGITCLVGAIYSLMLYSTERRGDWRLQIAGMTGLSLAVASNPTFLFPAGMIAVLFVVALPPLPAATRKEKRRKAAPA